VSLPSYLLVNLGRTPVPNSVRIENLGNVAEFSAPACPQPEIRVLGVNGIGSIEINFLYDLTPHQDGGTGHRHTKE
jgi:hypothetical protein